MIKKFIETLFSIFFWFLVSNHLDISIFNRHLFPFEIYFIKPNFPLIFLLIAIYIVFQITQIFIQKFQFIFKCFLNFFMKRMLK
jgi:hypothetical protein